MGAQYLKSTAKKAILDITKYGLNIDYLFDFEGLLPPLEAKVAVLKAEEENRIASLPKSSVEAPIKKAEVNPYARNSSPFISWSNEQLCQVVSRAMANDWILTELEKRGLEYGLSGEVIVSNQQKAETENARRQSEREKALGESIASNQQKAEAEDARKQAEQQKARILADIQNPSIQVTNIVSQGAIGTIEGRVTDDGTIDIVLVDGKKILELKSDGSFAHEV